MKGLDALYDVRFSQKERQEKQKVWKCLCEGYFQQFVGPADTLLEVACGFGEFSRNIKAGRKLAIDLNPGVRAELPPGIEFHEAPADAIPFPNASVDVVFVSNFFEHLESKLQMDNVLTEMLRVLRPGGRLVTMQPNVKYAGDAYWDFYDHHLPLSHLSAAEGFEKNGFRVDRIVPRFVPFSTKCAYPKHPAFVSWYLRMPWLWPLLGKQFVIVASKPNV